MRSLLYERTLKTTTKASDKSSIRTISLKMIDYSKIDLHARFSITTKDKQKTGSKGLNKMKYYQQPIISKNRDLYLDIQ